MKKKGIAVISILAICILSIFATFYIKKNNITIFNTDNSDISYEKSNYVSLPMLKVKTLNPITSLDKDSYYIDKLIFESLFYLDENLAASPGLVDSYELDINKKEIHITLKKNSFFSDGYPLTAQDVKFSIDSYLLSPKSLYANYVKSIRSVNIDKQDQYSLTIKYKDLNNISLENLIFPIVSKSQLTQYGGKTPDGDAFIPIGSGPYKVLSYNDITELKLDANTYYHGEKPKNILSFNVLVSTDDVIPMLDTGTISMGISESMSRETLAADKNISITNFPSSELELIGFNFDSEVVSNIYIRKAIAYCVDVNGINDDIYYKNGILCDSIYFPNYFGVKNEGEIYKFNLKKAKELLAKTNYKDFNNDGLLDIEEKKPLDIKILVNKQYSEKVLVAERISETLKEAGLSSELIFAENDSDFNTKLTLKNYDIFIASIHFNDNYDLRNLLHSKYGNLVNYQNQKLDLLLDRMVLGLSKEDKAETYIKIKSILKKDLPYYPMIYKTYGAMLSSNIRGVDAVYFNDYYKNAHTWYCEFPIENKN